jgi:hypothetical protein
LDMVSADGKTKFTYSVLSHRVSLSSVSIILFFFRTCPLGTAGEGQSFRQVRRSPVLKQ